MTKNNLNSENPSSTNGDMTKLDILVWCVFFFWFICHLISTPPPLTEAEVAAITHWYRGVVTEPLPPLSNTGKVDFGLIVFFVGYLFWRLRK